MSRETVFGSGWNTESGTGEASVLWDGEQPGASEYPNEAIEQVTGEDLYSTVARKVAQRKERMGQKFGSIKERFSRFWHKIKGAGEVAFFAPEVIAGAGLRATGRAAVRSAEAVGSGVVASAEATGRSAKAAGRGIARGAETAIRGVADGGEAVAGTAIALGKGGAELMSVMGEKGIRTAKQSAEFLQQSAEDIYHRTGESFVNTLKWGSEQAENVKNGVKTTARSVERGVIGWLERTKQRRETRKAEKAADKKARLESKFLERESDLIAKINVLQSQLDTLKLEHRAIVI